MDDDMDIKPRPDQRLYLKILRRMTPEERLKKALELSEFAKQLFSEGLRRRFPYLPACARSSGKGKIGEMPRSELVRRPGQWP